MSERQAVQVAEARGRPMLHWVGKRPLDYVTAFPAQLVETFNPTGENLPSPDFGGGAGGGGLLFHGDNKDVLAWLLTHGYRGKVNLIYIDPPFDSGADYVRRVQLRGVRTPELEGEAHSLGEQIQYTDIWANDMYLQFIYERLLLLKELLTEDGSIYLHCDWRKSHHLRCLMDEVFGAESFRNEISRVKCNPKNYTQGSFGNQHDTVLFYSKGDAPAWSRPFLERSDDEILEDFPRTAPDGRKYKTAPLHAPGVRSGETGHPWRGIMPPAGNHWRYVHATLDELDVQGLIEWSDTGNPRKVIYADESEGKFLQDVWSDVKDVGGSEYPTQKSETLLRRIILASSEPDDLVLDCFVGSGTTVAVAQKLGRRWIAADINKGAIQTTSKRLQAIICEQLEVQRQAQPALPGVEPETGSPILAPCSLSFSVYRVNDYDLQVQHNEAVNLAVELIGIERTKTDTFFDGTLGKRLAKIVPFNHPLTPLDLQLLQDELKARPDEERDVVVVCLGKEIAADGWLEGYNKHRPINRIEVVELRTDQKYGKFFVHQPARAQVKVERRDGQIVVEVEDFISPTIVERLDMDTPLFKAQIPDWRAMVDVVLIDTAYDGQVFNIALSDVPEKKDDLVAGRYELPAPEGETTVAVKIVDMLGEEVLVTETV